MSDAFNVDWTRTAGASNGQMIQSGDDQAFDAVFYLGKMPNFDLSDYEEVPHLRLQAPGSSTIYDQPVRPGDKERFPLAWAAFEAGRSRGTGGTPLAEWHGITEGDVRRLEVNGIRTVEQLARVADGHLGGLGFGGRLLRDQARAYVLGQTPSDPEKDALKEQVGKLTDIVGALMERLGGIEDPLIIPDEAEKPARGKAKADA